MKKVIILGAGLSGVSAGYFLKKKKIDPLVFEKEKRPGGMCSSHTQDGFTFDTSGHLLHFRSEETRSLVNSLLGDNLTTLRRNAWVYNFDNLIPYPFQANLTLLPPGIREDCLSGFIKARDNGSANGKPRNFLEWIYTNFGAGIAEHFMIPYNLKFWQAPLEDISHQWADRLVVKPSLEDIENSGNNGKKDGLGYHSRFYYPKRGGIEELVKAFARGLKYMRTGHEAREVDLAAREVRFANGRKEYFDTLISTIPLPELGKIIKGVPRNVMSAFRALRWISIYNVNLGIDRKVMPGKHWIYFPDKDINFFRVGFFHNFSSSLAPQGKAASYVEVSYPGGSDIDEERAATGIKKGLKRVGILNGGASIMCQHINDIKYAYPLYDRNYEHARKTIMGFLSGNGIIPCGRYGSWRYFSMEDVMMEAEGIAESIAEYGKNN